ncbi:class I SAM-dependent methyltransferase [Solirubrobacter sp. CPCC 204708]|nr:class I SAM-dependent methyltransferase [Solirubrobacter deserti]
MTPAGDFDYERAGAGYARRRRTDPRIAAHVHAALGDARTVLNVGAGAGSYEPEDRYVVAVEPSAAMRAQRPSERPAVNAVAEALPFDDDSFDAAMAMITVHQWADVRRGVSELRRVARGPVVILTFDPDALLDFWLAEYVPALLEAERPRFPPLGALGDRVQAVPIPLDCQDGFIEAFYGRPEAFLDPEVRAAQSAWEKTGVDVGPGLTALAEELASGAWDARHGDLRRQPEYVGSLRLVTSS